MRAKVKTSITPRGAAALYPAKGLFGFVVMLAAALLAVATLFFAAEGGARAQTLPLNGKIVVIDPGHGGSDLGATYTFPDRTTKLYEKDQTLDVASKLRYLLQGQGATVFMTRTDDKALTNTQRAQFANGKQADVLVSIHMNGSTDPKVDYTTTLFGKWQKDKAFAYAVFGDNVNTPKINPPTYGLRTLSAANGMGTIATRTPYSYASGVLIKSNMPAIIAETVFITNAQEAEWLKSGRIPDGTIVSRQQQIAEALKTGVVRYLAPSTTN